MNKYIECANNKMYQFFPIKTSVYNKHITINTCALIDLFVDKNKAKYLNTEKTDSFKKSLWKKYFHIYDDNDKFIYTRKGYSFNYEIQTNGFTVSLSNINNDDIDKQIKKKKLKAEASIKSRLLKKQLDDNEYIKHKTIKESNKLDDIVTKKEIRNKKISSMRSNFKRLTETEKQQVKYNKECKKDFPDIECLIKNSNQFTEQIKEKYNTGKLLICDPGKNNLLFCVNPNGFENKGKKVKYTDNFGISIRGNDKYMNYTNNTRLKFIRHHEYIKYINEWKSKSIDGIKSTLKSFEEKLAEHNSKSCNLYSFLLYCKLKIISLNFYRKYYNDKLIHKLSWFTYLNKWRHFNDLIRVIKNEFGNDVSFIVGNWSGKGKLKFMSTPNNILKKKLKEHFDVYEIDEYRTSKIHNHHYVKCNNLKHTYIDSNGSLISKKIHSVLTFKKAVDSINNTDSSKNTKSIFCGNIGRDRNAVLNMKNIVNNLLKTRIRPIIFSRSLTI